MTSHRALIHALRAAALFLLVVAGFLYATAPPKGLGETTITIHEGETLR